MQGAYIIKLLMAIFLVSDAYFNMFTLLWCPVTDSSSFLNGSTKLGASHLNWRQKQHQLPKCHTPLRMKTRYTVQNKKTVSPIMSVLQPSKDMWIYARQLWSSVTMSGKNRNEEKITGTIFLKKDPVPKKNYGCGSSFWSWSSRCLLVKSQQPGTINTINIM